MSDTSEKDKHQGEESNQEIVDPFHACEQTPQEISGTLVIHPDRQEACS